VIGVNREAKERALASNSDGRIIGDRDGQGRFPCDPTEFSRVQLTYANLQNHRLVVARRRS
jgi:hypothetical protein